jgi:hypothetical protein
MGGAFIAIPLCRCFTTPAASLVDFHQEVIIGVGLLVRGEFHPGDTRGQNVSGNGTVLGDVWDEVQQG